MADKELTKGEHDKMLEIYKINYAAEKEFQEKHKNFLNKRGITQQKYNLILCEIIFGDIEQRIRVVQDYLYYRGY